MTLIFNTYLIFSELAKIPNEEYFNNYPLLLSPSTKQETWKSFSPPLYNLIFFLMNNTQKIRCLSFCCLPPKIKYTFREEYFIWCYFFLTLIFIHFQWILYYPEYNQLSESRTLLITPLPVLNAVMAISRYLINISWNNELKATDFLFCDDSYTLIFLMKA